MTLAWPSRSATTLAGTPAISSKVAQVWRLCRARHKRHTCATLLLLAGEPAKVVSERLGHASVTTTLDIYSHVLPHLQHRATERLRFLLTPPSSDK